MTAATAGPRTHAFAALLVAVALLAACTSDDAAPASTAAPVPPETQATAEPAATTTWSPPAPTPPPWAGEAAPWLDRQTVPVPLDILTVSEDGSDTWVVVDAETGEWVVYASPERAVPLSSDASAGRFRVLAALGERAGDLIVFDFDSGVTRDIGPGRWAVVSPDGLWAVVATEGEDATLRVVETATGQRHDIGDAVGFYVEGFDDPVDLPFSRQAVRFAWSPDGVLMVNRGLFSNDRGVLYRASAPDWRPESVADGAYHGLTWSPDGKQVAWVERDGLYVGDPQFAVSRRVVEFVPSQLRRFLESDSGGSLTDSTGWLPPGAQLLAWSPDASRIAYTTGPAIHVVEVATGRVTVATPDGLTDVVPLYSFVWSPDGTRLAFAVPLRGDYGGVMAAFADGSGAYRLTDGPVEGVLAWRDSGIIVYLCRCH